MKFSRWPVFAVVALALAACGTPSADQATPKTSADLRINGTPYELNLKPGRYVGGLGGALPKSMEQYGIRMQTTSVYTLIDTRNGQVVGQAESALIKANFVGGMLRNERRVEVSDDGKRLLVQDDATEAYPSRRYILFQQKPDGTFETFYLAPPVVPRDGGQIRGNGYSLPWLHFNDPDFALYPRFSTPFNR